MPTSSDGPGQPRTGDSGFDYASIPPGYYDEIMGTGHPVQRAWHREKFARVRAELALGQGESLLDIGCGPGTFLGGFDPQCHGTLAGIDVAADQIDYARRKYGASGVTFDVVEAGARWPFEDSSFEAVSLIEVVEHLPPAGIRLLFSECSRVMRPGGILVLTTPNYSSHWPLLEWLIGVLSPLKYEDQHITRFTRLGFRAKIEKLLGERYRVEHVTTMHFLAPFLAVLSQWLSERTSNLLTPRHWAWPFGALIVARIRFLG